MITLLRALLGVVADAILRFFAEGRAEAAQRDLGAAKADQETQAVVSDVADKQAKNNALPRDPLSIADRLRAEADAADGGSRK